MMSYQYFLAFGLLMAAFYSISNTSVDKVSLVNDRLITITSLYPDANIQSGDFFSIRGDSCGLSWTSGIKLTKRSSNTWNVQITCPSTVKELAFKILKSESAWTIGPNFLINLQNSKSEYTVYPFFTPGTGTYEIHKRIYSLKLMNFRSVIVYLPASYKENTLQVYDNLLLMHDGQNLFDPSTAFMGQAWMVQNTVDTQIASGNIEDMIIAGVYNTGDRMDEYTYSLDSEEGFGGKGDLYLDFLEKDIIPLVLGQYRINQKLPQGVALIGSSLGGLISCYAGWTRSQTFKKVGCMSSSFWWNNQDFNNVVLAQKSSTFDPNLKIYLDSGDQGDGLDDKVQTLSVLQKLQTVYQMDANHLFYYLDQGGEHSEYYWGRRFSKPCIALFSPEPLP